MKTAMQLKALIRNASRKWHVEPEVLLRNYMMERLLERISISPYRTRFILKGGMLVASMLGMETRSTMDLDATVTGFTLSRDELDSVMKGILACPIDDGVSLSILEYEIIRDEAEYPGWRIHMEATLENVKQPLKIDITSGDIITPKEITYEYRLLLEGHSISVLAYNIETLLAEKVETILSRGSTSTRMRDYYDVYMLTALRIAEIEWTQFLQAFRNTSIQRESYERISSQAEEILRSIENSNAMHELWQRYQSKNPYAKLVSWNQATGALKDICRRIMKTE